MRRTTAKHGRWLAACAAIGAGTACALLAGLFATPAAGVTNLYAAQNASTGPELTQFAVAPTGALTPLPPAALGFGAQDIAITPDGRFAYVTRSFGTDAGFISQFARAPDGSMAPAGVVSGGSDPRGILVNPQGTRLVYVSTNPFLIHSQAIGAGGALGADTTVPVAFAPRFLAMTPSGTSLYVSVAGQGLTVSGFLQFDVDPVTGSITQKAVPFVGWPGGGPTDLARMTVSPDGGHLYAASGESDVGIAHFAIDPAGALTGGSVMAVPTDRSGARVLPITPDGLFAYAPTYLRGIPALGKISQFSRDPGTGALTPLFLPTVDYRAEANVPTQDAVASPDGGSLYLGQDGNVGEWAITSGGALLPRASHVSALGGLTNAGLVLAPSQAPVASFTATPAAAGQATAFNASASSDPDGTVARYDWAFGDGASLANGGPTPSHVYASAGFPVVTLTVTDADGTSTSKLWTGSRMLRNGGPSAQAKATVQIAPAPPPPPPPPAGPHPTKGKSITITTVTGKVLVKVPGSKRYVDVTTLREIPLGSRIDARRGQVRLTAEVNATTHATESSIFYAGIFVVAQTKGSPPILEARLVGGTFAGCQARVVLRGAVRRAAFGGPLAGPFALVAKKQRARPKRVVRRLWGKGKGNFRTAGKRSTATVRGTWWLVEDRCDGTLTRVRQGFVDVRDARLKKTVRLRAGKRSLYLAKAP